MQDLSERLVEAFQTTAKHFPCFGYLEDTDTFVMSHQLNIELSA